MITLLQFIPGLRGVIILLGFILDLGVIISLTSHFSFLTSQQKGNFTLKKVNDSLYYLNDWKLPYPVYQFQTGDVDGDGSEDAMVGVIKSTRFYPEKARRLFIFKQVNGKARALWMGSKLGGILEDFRLVDGKIRALESTTDSLFVVSDYKWDKFGMAFDRFIIKGVDQQTAITTFSQ